MIGDALRQFARLLGLSDDLAEDALHSERAARHVVSRRTFFGVAGAMATGLVFGDAIQVAASPHAGAFLAAKVAEVDALYAQFAEALSRSVWGNGGQALGRIAKLRPSDFELSP